MFSSSSSAASFFSTTDNNDNGIVVSTVTTAAGSWAPAGCARVDDYDLLPFHPNCQEYVLCQRGETTLMFSCPENALFDEGRRRCVEEGREECACVTVPMVAS